MTTALYRRYRPDSFEQVIGQEHVTVPLANAIDKHRINHAYLFSGPRGCGKTTSARILARCLNCVQGPTATPCGECDSCTDLATGGPGSLDVIEIDAASHGGVDDARDLRERATFAPTRDRYKVFIIDEAHMVTPAGFNALLKIVEEPPEHIKFIFATTEPDKVIGTIRSRTHHYPFRLVPPEPLMQYLETLANYEQIPIAPGVLSLVIRAGGGSVRDTLSVLDQLLAGATQEGVSYDLAVNLLGFTPENLLDDVVNALAAEDSPTVFRVVDQVVQSGQDPERFVQDLLERFRDVVIVRAAPDQASGILHGMPEDQLRRLEAQAQQLGAAEVSRAADITAAALTQMNGATSPRLHLELLMARLMLPATDETERGLAARIDRLERRFEYGGAPETPAGSPPPRQTAPEPAVPVEETGLSGAAAARAALLRERQAEAANEEQPPAEPQRPVAQPEPALRQEPRQEPQARPEPTLEPQQPEPAREQPAQPAQAPQTPQQAEPEHEQQAPPQQPEPQQPAAPSTPEHPAEQHPAQQPSQVEMVRRAWPEVLEFLKNESRLIWMTVNGNAQVVGFDGKLLTIGFDNDGARNTVQMRGGANLLAAGFNHVLGIQPELDLISGTSDGGSPKGPSRPARPQPQPPQQRPQAQPEQPPAAEQQQPQNPSQPTPPVAPQHTANPTPQASPQSPPQQPPQRPTQQPEQPPQSAPQQPSAPQGAPNHPQPPATGVAGWGTGQPDQAWGQPEPDWGAPDPNWGPPDDDDWMPDEDPWHSPPQDNPASQQPPRDMEQPPSQQSAPQQSAPVEPQASVEPEIATGPDPVASDGYAGFIPRNEPTDEPAIPAFAKSEAELRQEFQRRFGDVIPGSSGGNKPQQDSPKPTSGSRFADMVAQYGGQPSSGSESETPAQEEKTPDDDDDDYASEDDEIIEDSGLAGRSVVENVLNARLVEERNADGTPKL
ncbi:DNA polymerase III subunit gamma and tau [Yaniella halotolerans]|nr:DNA polymerase III subunit gamma and tau [Yaniella halotolerans]